MKVQGVYISRDKDKNCLYVGQSEDIHIRMHAHMSSAPWRKLHYSLEIIKCRNKMERISKEKDTIRNLNPKYNKKGINLPTDDEIKNLHYVCKIHKIYDGFMIKCKIKSYKNLAELIGMSENQILLVRLGLCSITFDEVIFIASIVGARRGYLHKYFSDFLFNLELSKKIIEPPKVNLIKKKDLRLKPKKNFMMDQIKKRFSMKSDKDIALFLGTHYSVISKIRNKKLPLSERLKKIIMIKTGWDMDFIEKLNKKEIK